jgi:hypothetical protein
MTVVLRLLGLFTHSGDDYLFAGELARASGKRILSSHETKYGRYFLKVAGPGLEEVKRSIAGGHYSSEPNHPKGAVGKWAFESKVDAENVFRSLSTFHNIWYCYYRIARG